MKKSTNLPARKSLSILFFLFLLADINVIAQSIDGKIFNPKGIQAWVKLDDSKVIHGLPWKVDAEKITIKSDQTKNWKNPNSNAEILETPIESVKSVRIKRIHAVWKGYGYGVLTGVAVGSVVALTYEAIEPDDFAILFIPIGGFLGSGIGIIAGSLPGKFF